jgi:hypothetical protein
LERRQFARGDSPTADDQHGPVIELQEDGEEVWCTRHSEISRQKHKSPRTVAGSAG